MATVLQIENREDEYNPHLHTPQDTVNNMNLDYWEEQIKATIASAAQLAVSTTWNNKAYLPLVVKADREQDAMYRQRSALTRLLLPSLNIGLDEHGADSYSPMDLLPILTGHHLYFQRIGLPPWR